MDTKSIDALTAEIAFLKERVATLEKTAFGEPSGFIEGWNNAGKFLGVCSVTCMKRLEEGKVPDPCKSEPFTRSDGRTFQKHTWRMGDLIAYAERK